MREHTRHRQAFDAYVQLGPERSLEALQRQMAADPDAFRLRAAPALRTVQRWSVAFHWQDRLADLERAARERDAEAHVTALREMNARHAKEGLSLQQAGIARLRALPEEELPPNAAIRAVVEGVRLERLARGEATERTAHALDPQDAVDLARFSATELRELAALAAQAARPAPPSESEAGA